MVHGRFGAGGMRLKYPSSGVHVPAEIAQVRAYGADIQLPDSPREEPEAKDIRHSNERRQR